MKLAFVIPDLELDYDIQLHNIKKYFPDSTLFVEINDLTQEYIVTNAIDVVIASRISRDCCGLLHELGVVTIIFGDWNYYYDIVDIVIDYKQSKKNVDSFTSPVLSVNLESPATFVDTAKLIKNLVWDSEFFGVAVAYVTCFRLSLNINKAISRYTIENNIQLIEFLCDCNDRESIRIAEKKGFSLVDLRMTFIKKLENVNPVKPVNNIVFRKAIEEDISKLEIMVKNMYSMSRYYFDDKFETKKAQKFYQCWIGKAVKGQFDDECWCLSEGEQLIAFCSIKYMQGKSARIGLIGVSKAYEGKGIGRRMIECIFEMLVKEGIAELTVATQGRNYPAQNLYQSTGFRIKESHLWYHKWC